MKNLYHACFLLMLSLTLIGCNTTDDQTEDGNESVENAPQEDAAEETQPDSENETEENDQDSEQESEEASSQMELETGSAEKVSREIEGMEDEIEVTNYEIKPYGIAYQLDTRFGAPEVNSDIMYAMNDDEYKLTLELLEDKDLDSTVSDLQDELVMEEYEEKSELENISSEENGLKGKTQYITYPVQGFYVYEIDEDVLVITYEYPAEGGDGMGPLLAAFRESISVQ